jgi:hypothetical protein
LQVDDKRERSRKKAPSRTDTAKAGNGSGSGIGLIVFLLFAGAPVLWEYLTGSNDSRPATKTDRQREDANSAKPVRPNDQGQPRRAIPVDDYAEARRAIPVEEPNPPPAQLLNGFEQRYSVVGIAEDDTLNIRSGPGATNDIVAQLPAGINGIRIVGDPVMNDTTQWVSITFGNHSGWVVRQYLQPEDAIGNPP